MIPQTNGSSADVYCYLKFNQKYLCPVLHMALIIIDTTELKCSSAETCHL